MAATLSDFGLNELDEQFLDVYERAWKAYRCRADLENFRGFACKVPECNQIEADLTTNWMVAEHNRAVENATRINMAIRTEMEKHPDFLRRHELYKAELEKIALWRTTEMARRSLLMHLSAC